MVVLKFASLIWRREKGKKYVSFEFLCEGSFYFLYTVEMAQLECGGCRTQLMYTLGAASVRCSCCQTINLARPGILSANLYKTNDTNYLFENLKIQLLLHQGSDYINTYVMPLMSLSSVMSGWVCIVLRIFFILPIFCLFVRRFLALLLVYCGEKHFKILSCALEFAFFAFS